MAPVRVEDYLDIRYRADLDVLVARWLRPVELPGLQQGYEQTLAFAQAGAGRHWLIDVRRRFNTHQVGAQWMVSDLLPRLAPVYLRDPAADSAFPPASYFGVLRISGASLLSANSSSKKVPPSSGCAPI